MKKVLFMVPSLGMGGMERVLVNYANLFSRRGYDVTVYNLTGDEEAIVKHFDKNIKYSREYSPVKNILHAGIKNVLKLNFRLLPWNAWIKFHSPSYLYKKYIKERFDVIISFFGITQMKIVGGCPDKTVKTIGWIHGMQLDSDIKPVGGLADAIKVYNSMGKIICVSDLSRGEVKDRFGREKGVYTVNNPNDTKKIRELSKEVGVPEKKRFTFVTAARFDDKQKGFTRLLNVCKKLNDEGLEYDYWLVGDGIDFEKIKALAVNLELKNIYFLGKQGNPYKYIKNADMYICASYSEGFSMVMMETVILATPMLSTDVSGAAEMLDNGKYGMIVANTEEGLYGGMKKIISDKALYAHYRETAEARKDYLSEDKIMDRVESIINGEI